MAKEYPNFYENIKEANMRLQYTVVVYDSEPYYVLCISDHKPDGIFRVYLNPLGYLIKGPHDYPAQERGAMMDEYMAKNPDCGILRKMMNSPLFNKFRPFPLGMCNYNGKAWYLERQPQRHTQQGMTQNMMFTHPVTLHPGGRSVNVDITSLDFKNCILASHPDIAECLKNLLDPDILNESVAFSREFALLRGPLDTIFVQYKSDVIGVLPLVNTDLIRLSVGYGHTKEVVSNLNIFKDIVIN